MGTGTEILAEQVRGKRYAIDNDLELLRVRMQKLDPRRIDIARFAKTAAPVAAGLGALWFVTKRRRSVRSLDQLLTKELADLYASEQELVPALSHLREQATNPDLKQAFEQHRLETIGQVDRLERVFRWRGTRPTRGSSDSVVAVVTDAERLLRRNVHPDVRDAWLIASAQRVEHIEIANYGTARAFAETLGLTEVAQLLQQTLDEERAADRKLTQLATRFVNPNSIRNRSTA